MIESIAKLDAAQLSDVQAPDTLAPGAPGSAGTAAGDAGTAGPSTSPSKVAAPPAEPQGTRLLVEPTRSGTYVYRIVDAATGRLLVELPRERVEDLPASDDYEAGALVSTRA